MIFHDCKIGDVFEIVRGGSPRPIDKFITDDPSGFNWIMIGDAAEGSKYIRSTKKKVLKSALSKTRVVQPGDFLLTNSMSFGRPYITQVKGCIHDGWLALTPKDPQATDPDFFYYLLGSPLLREAFERRAAGAVVKNLNINLVRDIDIRIPATLAEQRIIASILDRADGICRKREQALTLADDFLRSVFLDMFGDPRTNPKGLPTRPLAECSEFVSGGTPSKANTEFWSGEFPWVSPKDMKVDTIVDAQDHVSETVFEQTSLKKIRAGTPLIVVRGMILVHTVPMAITAREVAINQDMKAINFSQGIDPLFGFWCLKVQHEAILARVETAAHGTKRLNTARLGKVPITIPDEDAQQEFLAIVKQFNAVRAAMTEAWGEAAIMFSAISQRAFSGKL
jgi:type I restriction enzyme S subunit